MGSSKNIYCRMYLFDLPGAKYEVRDKGFSILKMEHDAHHDCDMCGTPGGRTFSTLHVTIDLGDESAAGEFFSRINDYTASAFSVVYNGKVEKTVSKMPPKKPGDPPTEVPGPNVLTSFMRLFVFYAYIVKAEECYSKDDDGSTTTILDLTMHLYDINYVDSDKNTVTLNVLH